MRRKDICLAFILVLVLGLSVPGCAPKAAARVDAGQVTPDPRDRLQADLEHIFSDPNFASAQWGVEVISLDRGETLYEHNAGRLYMPASNNKLLTSAAALVRLGPDFRFETGVSTDGQITDGTLRGNLIIKGSGDPSVAGRFHSGDPFAVFKDWARQIKEKGIRKIEGDIIGDDHAFPEPWIGAAWEWDDLPHGYAAPVSALQFNENLVTVEITPADQEGALAAFRSQPLSDYLAVDCRVTTGARGSESQIDVERAETGEAVMLRGQVPLGAGTATQSLAVRYPTVFYLRALKRTLQGEGIEITPGETRRAPGGPDRNAALKPLFAHTSPPLAEILKPLLKVSQNLYAETLTRTLGLTAAREGTFDNGKEVVEEMLRRMGIEKGTYLYADGSGLSRRNLISADLLVRIFKYMYHHKAHAQFYEALPIAGVDGTIAGRMKGTRAENNVHAKTGTIAGVRSLSGYIRTADGEMLAFAMIANNFLVSSRAAEYVQDAAAERIANFTRK